MNEEFISILVAVAVVAGIVLFFMYAARGGEKILAERAEKLKRARPAQAKILSYSEGSTRGTGNHGRYQGVHFRLQVTPPGGAAYETKTYWEVYQMAVPQLQVGNTVKVKIDADDPQVIYPNMPSVEYAWLEAQLQSPKAPEPKGDS